MITGELRSKVDRIWDTMWSGGISNPLSVIEQLTYLLFIKRLDELHTLKEAKANRTKTPIEEPVFSPGQEHLRWSRFKETAPERMFETVRDEVFPFIKSLGGNGDAGGEGGSTYTHHMKDALFMMPTARVLANVVDQLDGIDMSDRDTKGDLYEYMLGKIATAGQNGQFRTPRHIIKLMVDMTAPAPKDVICDPACGTAGFLIAASEHLVENHGDAIYKDEGARRRFNDHTFHGYDFDSTMLRIGSMNMLLHGVENPDIRYRDSLAEADDDDAEKYSLVLANPPFAGSLDYESTAKDLQQVPSRPRRPNCCSSRSSCACFRPAGALPSSFPTGCCSDRARRTRPCARSWSRTRSSTRLSPCRRGCSNPTPASRRPSCCSPRPTPGGRTTSGSTTCRRMDIRWTTSVRSGAGEKRPHGHPRPLAKPRQPKRTASGPTGVFSFPRRRSPRTITTSPSTATRRWSTRRWNTTRRTVILEPARRNGGSDHEGTG